MRNKKNHNQILSPTSRINLTNLKVHEYILT